MDDFDRWHDIKVRLHSSRRVPYGYKEREVWWLAVGQNIGVEENGKGREFSRPVLILKGFSKYGFWGLPLSTTQKRSQYYYPVITGGKEGAVLLSQLRMFDTHRLIKRYTTLEKSAFEDIKRAVVNFLK